MGGEARGFIKRFFCPDGSTTAPVGDLLSPRGSPSAGLHFPQPPPGRCEMEESAGEEEEGREEERRREREGRRKRKIERDRENVKAQVWHLPI